MSPQCGVQFCFSSWFESDLAMTEFKLKYPFETWFIRGVNRRISNGIWSGLICAGRFRFDPANTFLPGNLSLGITGWNKEF